MIMLHPAPRFLLSSFNKNQTCTNKAVMTCYARAEVIMGKLI